ncbi:NAD(P)/FAD-dependent oxidoreductase [Pontibacter sp. G13]|uniref:FAD-dependent oxidoreductase n=1 Tax=Pontibacter sp. G13 TaxID=3074898 RepID=UPI00288A75BE|nr:NAD(P)/FAD-dependent oxidoreductase [Pontibacter sp. G13]WNJ18639.1 NAD(P)/FAD-dependent oxidoreductase [Pontibacter sp. G13]
MDNPKTTFNLVGAGLAGSLMTVYLAQKGHEVHVFERRPDMRKNTLDGGRSINLALSARGIKALEETGLLEDIMEISIPMYGRIMHGKEGTITHQSYSNDGKSCIYSVSRAELNMRLMTLAESHENVHFQFDVAADDVNLKTGEITLKNLQDGSTFQAPGERTIAADGAFSAVRYAMQKMPRFDFSQDYLAHGYKELTIPAGPNGEFQLDKNALHIWPRGHFMMIALPNMDGSFTCTLFFPFEGPQSFDALNTREEVQAFFEAEFPDAIPLMPTLLDDYFENPTSSLVTIRCYPWILADKIALLGDASHAIVPFFGQGMNAAFEDCTVMAACVDQGNDDWKAIFEDYQKQRKVHADAIANMALENFIEMRDKTADEDFLFRKKVEHVIGRNIDAYKSRYELVSFSTIPYADAYRQGERNMEILAELMENLDHPDDVDIERAKHMIVEQ